MVVPRYIQGPRTLFLARSAPIVAGALSLFIVTYPLFDCDLYWHLANGRAMIAVRRIVNEDVFSYTHFGERFVNHEWLSQVLLYSVWAAGGSAGLFALKYLLTSLVVLLVYRTATTAGGDPWLAVLLSALATLAGIQQYHVRPELFSLLNLALLSYVLHRHRARKGRSLELHLVPILFLVWDWLHGAVVGLAFFTILAATENLKAALPRPRRPALCGSALRHLNVCYVASLAVAVVSPYGLRSYGHFLILASGDRGAEAIVELQPMWRAAGDCLPFVFMLGWALAAIAARIRAFDPTDLLPALAFGGAALRYNRLAGMAAIVLVPIIAGHVAAASGKRGRGRRRRFHGAVLASAWAVLLVAGYHEKIGKMKASIGPAGTHVLPSPTALGLSTNAFLTPAGGVRFVRDTGLRGNMYNNANLGGYLSYYLAPERRIFQYNLPPIFGDTTRFVRNPRELDKWHVDYAFAGSNRELTRLFPSRDWAPVYCDYVSTLVVRRTPRHQGLIDEYEIRHFRPELSLGDLRGMASRPAIFPRLAFETGVYLAYAQDERIAGLWGKWLADHPDLLARPRMAELLAKATALNAGLQGVRSRPERGGADVRAATGRRP